MIWPFLFPTQPCARCGFPVDQFDALDVLRVEEGTGREYPAWVHAREVCQEIVTTGVRR